MFGVTPPRCRPVVSTSLACARATTSPVARLIIEEAAAGAGARGPRAFHLRVRHRWRRCSSSAATTWLRSRRLSADAGSARGHRFPTDIGKSKSRDIELVVVGNYLRGNVELKRCSIAVLRLLPEAIREHFSGATLIVLAGRTGKDDDDGAHALLTACGAIRAK